jgi:AcrR family transcriptional regulator
MPVPRGSTIDPARTRAAILESATELFYERGLDGIGVAELCSRLGISKETLYRHFGSKDGLAQVVLEMRSDRIIHWLEDSASRGGEEPREQLAAVFDVLQQWYEEPSFRGCAIVNAATQHRVKPIQDLTARHLDRYITLLTGIAERGGAAEPEVLGRQLLMLVEGATTVAANHHTASAGTDARQAALSLLSAASRD